MSKSSAAKAGETLPKTALISEQVHSIFLMLTLLFPIS
jgi:hypothetical protein